MSGLYAKLPVQSGCNERVLSSDRCHERKNDYCYSAMIVLLDNVDSFVHNLARYFVRLGHVTKVVRTTAVTVEDIRGWEPAALVFSPGPGAPANDSAAIAIIRELWQSVPMLGVCLGHQQIVHALGGNIGRAGAPCHGRATAIEHDRRREFTHLPHPFYAARYHSLVSHEPLPDALEISAHTEQDVVMAVRALEHPVFGWQFHPESVLTPHGFDLLRGFLRQSGLSATDDMIQSESPPADGSSNRGPGSRRSHPVTF
jgi:anthranilate synthase/aminodeoxychorismate synthase-like glutamine amidotransferase